MTSSSINFYSTLFISACKTVKGRLQKHSTSRLQPICARIGLSLAKSRKECVRSGCSVGGNLVSFASISHKEGHTHGNCFMYKCNTHKTIKYDKVGKGKGHDVFLLDFGSQTGRKAARIKLEKKNTTSRFSKNRSKGQKVTQEDRLKSNVPKVNEKYKLKNIKQKKNNSTDMLHYQLLHLQTLEKKNEDALASNDEKFREVARLASDGDEKSQQALQQMQQFKKESLTSEIMKIINETTPKLFMNNVTRDLKQKEKDLIDIAKYAKNTRVAVKTIAQYTDMKNMIHNHDASRTVHNLKKELRNVNIETANLKGDIDKNQEAITKLASEAKAFLEFAKLAKENISHFGEKISQLSSGDSIKSLQEDTKRSVKRVKEMITQVKKMEKRFAKISYRLVEQIKAGNITRANNKATVNALKEGLKLLSVSVIRNENILKRDIANKGKWIRRIQNALVGNVTQLHKFTALMNRYGTKIRDFNEAQLEHNELMNKAQGQLKQLKNTVAEYQVRLNSLQAGVQKVFKELALKLKGNMNKIQRNTIGVLREDLKLMTAKENNATNRRFIQVQRELLNMKKFLKSNIKDVNQEIKEDQHSIKRTRSSLQEGGERMERLEQTLNEHKKMISQLTKALNAVASSMNINKASNPPLVESGATPAEPEAPEHKIRKERALQPRIATGKSSSSKSSATSKTSDTSSRHKEQRREY